MVEEKSERPAHPILERPLFKYVVAPIIVIVVGAVLVALLIGGDDDKSAPNVPAQTSPAQAPRADAPQAAPPKDAIEQIARRDIWAATPDTFRSAQPILKREEFAPVPVEVDSETLQPTVVTPHQLALPGSDYEGQDVVLVGRVVDDVSLTPLEDHLNGLDHETRLAGSRNSGVYVGSQFLVAPDRGDTVWVIGRVAAVGRAETLGGRPLRAAYFIAADDFRFTGYDDSRLPGSVRDAVRTQSQRPLEPS